MTALIIGAILSGAVAFYWGRRARMMYELRRIDYQLHTQAIEAVADGIDRLARAAESINPADVGDSIARSIDDFAQVFGRIPLSYFDRSK